MVQEKGKNKTVKEILRLLKRDNIIDEREYIRIWTEFKRLYNDRK